jgi:hypothetical protein
MNEISLQKVFTDYLKTAHLATMEIVSSFLLLEAKVYPKENDIFREADSSYITHGCVIPLKSSAENVNYFIF